MSLHPSDSDLSESVYIYVCTFSWSLRVIAMFCVCYQLWYQVQWSMKFHEHHELCARRISGLSFKHLFQKLRKVIGRDGAILWKSARDATSVVDSSLKDVWQWHNGTSTFIIPMDLLLKLIVYLNVMKCIDHIESCKQWILRYRVVSG